MTRHSSRASRQDRPTTQSRSRSRVRTGRAHDRATAYPFHMSRVGAFFLHFSVIAILSFFTVFTAATMTKDATPDTAPVMRFNGQVVDLPAHQVATLQIVLLMLPIVIAGYVLAIVASHITRPTPPLPDTTTTSGAPGEAVTDSGAGVMTPVQATPVSPVSPSAASPVSLPVPAGVSPIPAPVEPRPLFAPDPVRKPKQKNPASATTGAPVEPVKPAVVESALEETHASAEHDITVKVSA